MNRTWKLAASFDTAFAYRKDGTTLDNLSFTKHDLRKRFHYKVAREEFGFNAFRDGLGLSRLVTGSCEIDWDNFYRHAEELAELSLKNGKPEIDLVIYHYGIPFIKPEDFTNGKLADFLCQIASELSTRWKGCFSGYVVSVENGYGTAMQTSLNHWRYSSSRTEPAKSWWELYEAIMRSSIAMAKTFMEIDPDTHRIACEPFFHNHELPFQDQIRSLTNLLGRSDEMAQLFAPSQTDQWGGCEDLLTKVGLNFYGNSCDDFWNPEWPLSKLVLTEKQYFPNHQLVITETGNCQMDKLKISCIDWLEMIDREINKANAQDAGVSLVTWAPFLSIEDFESPNLRAPGSLLAIDHTKVDKPIIWDEDTKRLAKVIREYTSDVSIAPTVTPVGLFTKY